jgi:zinc protease
LAEVLREPSFPAPELEQLRSENLASIDASRREPPAMASRAFQRHLHPFPPGDPRHVDDPDEATAQYKAATLDQVKAFHQEFLGASNGELAVVGDFDDKWMGPVVGDVFGGWESRRKYERIPLPFVDVPPVSQTLEAPDKANAVLLSGENLKLRDDYPEYPALVLGNYMLGGGFLNSRLAVRIRQKEGLSYGVGSSLSASSIDESGSFSVSAIHAPQNTEKLEQAMREELQRALTEGFTANEIDEARKGLLQGRQVGRAQDGSLASQLARYLFLGRTMEWDAGFEEKLKALTGDQIAGAMRKFIDLRKLTVVRAGDFTKKK